MKVNDIIDGVSIKLNEIFGDDYTIYTDNVKQDLKFPCFFIKKMPSSKKKLIGSRYQNKLNLIVHAILENEDMELLNDISDKLYELEYITLINKDILRGTEIKTEISDGVLLFFITYQFFTYKEENVDVEMKDIVIQGGLKG